MPYVLDLKQVAESLQEAQEGSDMDEAGADINPYLFETLLPLLEQGQYPLLKDIDFDAFDLEDGPNLVYFLQESERIQYRLESLNRQLGELLPYCPPTRAFL